MKMSLRSKLSFFVKRRLQIERRGSKRVVPVHRTLCLVQVPGEADRATAVVQNISVNGVGVLVDREYLPGTVLNVLLVNASHTFAAAMELKVVRCFRVAVNRYFLAGPFARPLTHDEAVPFII
jgi:hypothetical protein